MCIDALHERLLYYMQLVWSGQATLNNVKSDKRLLFFLDAMDTQGRMSA